MSKQGRDLFVALYKSWSHNPVATFSLCLLAQAYEVATRFNLPRTYDAEYLALAERLNCEFWTADEVLVNSVQAKFPNIRWLGNFTP